MQFKEDVTRSSTFLGLKAWYEGESKELEKWIGFGFFNHIFVFEKGNITLYYDVEEGDKFHEVLIERLTENFFNDLCDHFFKTMRENENLNTNENIFKILVKLWPAFTIFDELSKYPELGNDFMIRRLLRVRRTTEDFSYRIENMVEEDVAKDCILFQGGFYKISFEEFIENKNFEIIK